MSLPEYSRTEGATRRRADRVTVEGLLRTYSAAAAVQDVYRPRGLDNPGTQLTDAELADRLPEDRMVASAARDAFAQVYDAAAFLQQELVSLTYSADLSPWEVDIHHAVFFIDHAQQRVPEIVRTAAALLPGQPNPASDRQPALLGLESPEPAARATGPLAEVQRIAFAVRILQHSVAHAVDRVSRYEDTLDFSPMGTRVPHPVAPAAQRDPQPAISAPLPMAPAGASPAQLAAFAAARRVIEGRSAWSDLTQAVRAELSPQGRDAALSQRASRVASTFAVVRANQETRTTQSGDLRLPEVPAGASPEQELVIEAARAIIQDAHADGRSVTFSDVDAAFPEPETQSFADNTEAMITATEAIARSYFERTANVAAARSRIESGDDIATRPRTQPAPFGVQDLQDDLRDIVDDLANAGEYLNRILGPDYAVQIYAPTAQQTAIGEPVGNGWQALG
jgi:hypothetical protein